MPKTIAIDGAFDDWEYVSPRYTAHKGSTLHRNSKGWEGSYYTNATGRNDFVAAKVARDDTYVYFYIETADEITDVSGPAWMRLFIDRDRNWQTGWEGYDLMLTGTASGTYLIKENSGNGWEWTTVGDVDYTFSGNKMEVRVARARLATGDDQLDFAFKWSDNMQEEGDILDFYVNGDVAPGGRFNYHFSTLMQ